MKYILNTNICIYSFKGLYNLPDRIKAVGYDEFAISEITLAELIYGAHRSQNVQRNMDVVNTRLHKASPFCRSSARWIFMVTKKPG